MWCTIHFAFIVTWFDALNEKNFKIYVTKYIGIIKQLDYGNVITKHKWDNITR